VPDIAVPSAAIPIEEPTNPPPAALVNVDTPEKILCRLSLVSNSFLHPLQIICAIMQSFKYIQNE
jgi:hypothetical protein